MMNSIEIKTEINSFIKVEPLDLENLHTNIDIKSEPDDLEEFKPEIFEQTQNNNFIEKITKSAVDFRIKSFHCDICNRSFYHENSLIIHKNNHPVFLECDVCKKKLANRSALISHQLTHSDEKPYKCEICAKCFSHPTSLRLHKKIHNRETPPQSFHSNFVQIIARKSPEYQVVADTSTQTKSPTVQKRPVVPERRFECDVCQKRFTTRSALSVHKIIHLDTRPKPPPRKKRIKANLEAVPNAETIEPVQAFECDICKNTFTQNSSLKIHKRIHTGETPYKCGFCEKSFISRSRLTMHVVVHNGDMPFRCIICKKRFPTRYRLNLHKKVHAEKNNKCDICGLLFSDDEILVHKFKHKLIYVQKLDVLSKSKTTEESLEQSSFEFVDVNSKQLTSNGISGDSDLISIKDEPKDYSND